MAVEICAEVSTNHGGDLELAKAFIWQCADAGADFVKFQSHQVKHLRPGDPQADWMAQAELSDEAHHVLIAECTRARVKFLTTCFTADRVPFLASLGLEAIKIGSGESHEPRLRRAVEAAMRTEGSWSRVFVSYGIRPLMPASAWVAGVYLRCCSRYPHPAAFARFPYTAGSMAGYSDHSLGVEGCQLAIIDGATLIEKHVQLPEQKRPPKPYEATMAELRALRQFADEDPARFIGRWQANL